MENEDPLVLVDLNLLFRHNLFLDYILLSLFGLIVVDFALLRANEAFIEQVFVLQVINVLFSESLLAFDMILQ
jgi:hypothetical protein